MTTEVLSFCHEKLAQIHQFIDEEKFKKLSQVKKKILYLFLESEWVSSYDLLQKTQQKYFDRRIREMRSEFGICVEVKHDSLGYFYKWDVSKKTPITIRKSLSASQRKKLFEEARGICQVCKSKCSEERLVADHRIPVSRNGSGDVSNFQALCKGCNNQKRAQCRDCTFDCNVCPFAFPDLFSRVYVIGVKEDGNFVNLSLRLPY